MTTLREAAQQAMEAEGCERLREWAAIGPVQRAAVESFLAAALEQQEQEPVAWMVYTLDGKSVCVTDSPADFTDQHRALPLYTTHPAATCSVFVAPCGTATRWCTRLTAASGRG